MFIVVFNNNEPARGFDEIADIAQAYYSSDHQLLNVSIKECVSVNNDHTVSFTPEELQEMIEELEVYDERKEHGTYR